MRLEERHINGPRNDCDRGASLSRRALLNASLVVAGGVAVAGSTTAWLPQSASASAATVPVTADRFMAASHLLIQHQLSPGVGARMAVLLQTRISTLADDLDTIIRVAREKHARTVEDFFDALPDGQLKTTAHRIISGWYAGVVDDSPTAEVLAYEEALMYQPTRDATAIPTYSFDGPDDWTNVDPPLSAMPEF